MTSRAEQMTKDNALVALPNRQEIRKCNMRIDQKMKRPKETTYQVVLNDLILTTCYEAFLITAKVPVICISSETLFYGECSTRRINLGGLGLSDREQRCKEVRQDVLPQIYQGNHQPLSEKEPFHFNEEPTVHATPTRKSPWMKRAAKITFAGSKKKTKAKADTGKGLKVLSEVALSKEAQLKEVLRRSKQDFHISHASGSGDDSNKDNDDEEEALDKAGNDDDDGDDDDEEEEENADDIDFSNTEDDDEKNEEGEDNYEMLYKDVNVNLQHEDVDMTKADQGGAQNLNLQYEDTHLLNLENVSPAEYTLDSVMDTNAQPTSSTVITTTPLPPPSVIPLIQQTTLTPAPITHVPTIPDSTTYVPVLPDFASVFQFNQRVSSLEQEVSQFKQVSNSS
ncbi:hypothetical protein Tco_1402005 [Tanacetum coccineum]